MDLVREILQQIEEWPEPQGWVEFDMPDRADMILAQRDKLWPGWRERGKREGEPRGERERERDSDRAADRAKPAAVSAGAGGAS